MADIRTEALENVCKNVKIKIEHVVVPNGVHSAEGITWMKVLERLHYNV